MNKNLMKVAFVGVIALIAGINVYNAQKTVTLSDIAMENVEALADTELFDRITRCREHGCVIDFLGIVIIRMEAFGESVQI